MNLPTRYLCCLFTAVLSSLGQAQHIIAANGDRVDVQRIRAKPDGTLVVTVNGSPQEIAPGQYRQAVGVKPPEYDAALKALQAGELESGTQTMQKILRTSAFQSWDVLAGKALIESSLAQDSVSSAKRVYDQLATRYGDSFLEVFPDMQITQWNLQIADGKTEGLEEELTAIILEGDNRVKRGMAQIARGDLKRRQREFDSAVLDYLRTVYFYSEVADIHAEALYKTALTFSEIGDTGRLRTYQQTLKETYPDSRFAAMPITN